MPRLKGFDFKGVYYNMVRSRGSIGREEWPLQFRVSEFRVQPREMGLLRTGPADASPEPHAALPVLTKVPTASPPACAWQVVFEFKRVCRKAADAGLQGTSALHSRTLPALWE